MAIIKSFTSLEQSKKLAEILPLESADMFCADVFDKEKETHSYNFHILSTWGFNTFEELKDRENRFVCFIPAWSLAALLSVLPEGIIDNCYVPNIQKENGKYSIAYGDDELLCITDNPIDACYEMIIKLHELKML